MSAVETLAPVINIDEEKCVNCYACIDACPVKYCMDGSGEKLTINHNLCIGCGNCITVCTHKARRIIDDTERFFADLKRGEKMIVVAAPAVASVFQGVYLKLNGYLKSLGVDAVFDVSFGAELTVVSYLNYIKAKNPKIVIAQPCPAIVSYIEIYQSELLPFLAPAESPMLHSIKMIRHYFPEYRNHKIAVISPCAAKKREFVETGLGDYNVTMLAMKRTIEEQRVELSSFPAVEYAGKSAERAVMFSSPGGLLDTAERFVPGIRRNTRKIEGVNAVYHYLKEISSLLNKRDIQLPLLVDCLNCEKGCNGGPGTGNSEKALEEIESPVRKRSAALESALNPKQREKLYKKYHALLNQYWKPGLYERKYRDLSGNFNIKQPSERELTEVFRSMKKLREEDMYDCTSCGYGTCRAMAVAIFNGLNKPSNCAHYNIALLEEEHKKSAELNGQLKTHIQDALEVIEKINALLEKLNVNIKTQFESVTESSEVTGKMVNSLLTTSELSRQKRESVMTLIENTAKGQDAMKETVESVKGISESIDGIASAIKIISVIAANTNLLSMNAAIEAAHAGDAGKGFAVVADEIRRLSETTRENSRSISQTLSNIIAGITDTSKRSSDTGSLIDEMSSEINGFAGVMTELMDTLGRLSSESSSITGSLKNLREQSAVVKTDYAEMMSLTDKLLGGINYLAVMQRPNVRHALRIIEFF